MDGPLQEVHKCTYTPRRLRCNSIAKQLPENYFPKVPAWRLELDLNLRPSGRKAPNLPLNYHAPQLISALVPMSTPRSVYACSRSTSYGYLNFMDYQSVL